MITLELIELADLVRPEQLVDEILRQNPELPVPVPLEEVARLAGISDFKPIASEGFEGALIANAEKSEGVIFYSTAAARPRQRFTIGHELGHFLLPWHRQSSFQCKAQDLAFGANTEWEVQANQFSAELIMPKPLVMKRLRRFSEPDLLHVLELAKEFETSIEMTARRYVELNEYPCAIVFAKDNLVRYSTRSEFFEHPLCVRKGDRLPTKSPSRQATGSPEEWDELDSYWWLKEDSNGELPDSLYEQTLRQDNGFKLILLTYE
jgi:Zn-dependent peptidase ImmA (M78 family)